MHTHTQTHTHTHTHTLTLVLEVEVICSSPDELPQKKSVEDIIEHHERFPLLCVRVLSSLGVSARYEVRYPDGHLGMQREVDKHERTAMEMEVLCVYVYVCVYGWTCACACVCVCV